MNPSRTSCVLDTRKCHRETPSQCDLGIAAGLPPKLDVGQGKRGVAWALLPSLTLVNGVDPGPCICRHSGTCFPTNSGNGTLQGKSSSPKHSCCMLRGGGQKNRENGHTGSERQEAKANEGVGEATHERDLHQYVWNNSTVQQPAPLPKLDRFETS